MPRQDVSPYLKFINLFSADKTWASPYINRFLQPDSIIPNPANPQSWNRYSYVINNPIAFNDPSGHTYLCDAECEERGEVRSPLVIFDETSGSSLSAEEREQITESVNDIAERMATVINQHNMYCDDTYDTCPSLVSAEDTFLAAFDGPLTFKKVKHSCATYFNEPSYNCWGSFAGGNTINIYTNAEPNKIVGIFQFPVHEMFHAIDGATGYTARDFFVKDALLMSQGGLDLSWPWSQSSENYSWEVFADTGVAWTYNHYNQNPVQFDIALYTQAAMNNFMKQFLLSAYYGLP